MRERGKNERLVGGEMCAFQRKAQTKVAHQISTTFKGLGHLSFGNSLSLAAHSILIKNYEVNFLYLFALFEKGKPASDKKQLYCGFMQLISNRRIL